MSLEDKEFLIIDSKHWNALFGKSIVGQNSKHLEAIIEIKKKVLDEAIKDNKKEL